MVLGEVQGLQGNFGILEATRRNQELFEEGTDELVADFKGKENILDVAIVRGISRRMDWLLPKGEFPVRGRL